MLRRRVDVDVVPRRGHHMRPLRRAVHLRPLHDVPQRPARRRRPFPLHHRRRMRRFIVVVALALERYVRRMWVDACVSLWQWHANVWFISS